MREVVPVLSVLGLMLDVPAALRKSSMYLKSGSGSCGSGVVLVLLGVLVLVLWGAPMVNLT